MTEKVETKTSKNIAPKKQMVSKLPKIKYDAKYIAYIQNGESGAVFITRDIADEIDTRGKWIDVVKVEFKKRHDGINDYRYFVVELFDRREQPDYEKHMIPDDKKYLTWQVATRDIADQRDRGIKGSKYLIFPKLINQNKGKWITVDCIWNKTFNHWVLDGQFTSSYEWRKRRQYCPPAQDNWTYEIMTTRKINDKQLEFIINHDDEILRKILEHGTARLEFLGLK